MCSISGKGVPPVLVCLIYRPPDVSLNSDPLFTLLRDLCSDYSHKVIMGDLNAALLKNNSGSRFIKSLTNELSLKIINHGHTHRTSGSTVPESWLDLICVDNSDVVLNNTNKLPPFCTDHNLINVKIKLFIPKPPKDVFSYRKLNKICPESIFEVLNSYDWSPFRESCLDTSLTCLNTNLQAVIDHLAPLKIFNPKKLKQSWIYPELQILIEKRKAIVFTNLLNLLVK